MKFLKMTNNRKFELQGLWKKHQTNEIFNNRYLQEPQCKVYNDDMSNEKFIYYSINLFFVAGFFVSKNLFN